MVAVLEAVHPGHPPRTSCSMHDIFTSTAESYMLGAKAYLGAAWPAMLPQQTSSVMLTEGTPELLSDLSYDGLQAAIGRLPYP